MGRRVNESILYILRHHAVAAGADVGALTGAAADAKDIGIYTNRKRAEEAIARLRAQPGFRDWPGGFRIQMVGLDEDLWPKGFLP